MENRKSLLPKVFMWLFIGILVTFVGGFLISENSSMMESLITSNTYWIFLIVEIVIAVALHSRLSRLNKHVAICLYLLYTFLTGLTVAVIFLAYELDSIMIIFLITSLLFALFAFIGKCTKIDLSKFWVYLLIGLIAIIILGIVNIFLLNNTLNMITSILGIIVFLGYIAYDTQMILKSDIIDDAQKDSYAVIFAFNLYIDFINIFMDLLNLFGNSKD